ncbi:MAG: anti-sigma regulatory factor [Polyangiaceae bacterium]
MTARRCHQLPIAVEDDIIVVRRAVRTLAEAHGFDTFASAALVTATSELTRNAWSHAGGGVATIDVVEEGNRVGVRVTLKDSGPGIADLPAALSGGFSTARSLGLGLSGSRRLVDQFDLQSTVGQGTTVEILKWKML